MRALEALNNNDAQTAKGFLNDALTLLRQRQEAVAAKG
jgi:hypothetical protein